MTPPDCTRRRAVAGATLLILLAAPPAGGQVFGAARVPASSVPTPSVPAAHGATPSAAPAVCSAGRTALVLAGGGVHGMAHVGVIQLLDSLGIVPDLVVGTSVGAIVGALYASGYTGDEIEALTRRYDVGADVGRYAPQPIRSLGPQPPLLVWEEGERGMALQAGGAPEGRVNTLLSALLLRGNLLARGSFDSLPIPFRAVATDLASGERVVLADGDLARAVRASSAIPLVFSPVVVGGRVLVDGGLSENVPVRTARELGATRIIVSALDQAPVDPTLLGSPGEVASQLIELLFAQPLPPADSFDVALHSDVTGRSNLDFSQAAVREMVARGRAAARPLAERPCLPRRPPAGRPVPPVAAGLTGPDTPASMHAFLRASLGVDPAKPLAVDSLQARIAKLGELAAIRAIWLGPERRADSIVFVPRLVLAPRHAVGAGVVYDNDLGGRAWIGLVDRRALHRSAEWALRGAVGEYARDAMLSLRRSDQESGHRLSPLLSLSLSDETVRLFTTGGGELSSDLLPVVREERARLGFDQPLGGAWSVQLAALAHHWREAGPGDPARKRRATAIGGSATISGHVWRGRGSLVADAEWSDEYRRAVLAAGARRTFGRLTTESALRVGAATAGAPLTARFVLGGDEGFAGLRIGERRALATASLSTDLGFPILGPLGAVVTLMSGRSSDAPGRVLAGPWLAGARAGIGTASPIGPVRLQYGVSDGGRGMWFLRLGRWF